MPRGAENPKGLCGRCHEDDEEYPVRLKPGFAPGTASPEAIARRTESRKQKRNERAALREAA